MRRLASIATTAGRLLGPVVVACAALVFAVLAVGPRTGAYRTYTVLTASMRPDMPEGTVVVSTPIALHEARVGDVITYRIPVEDRRVVTHRVVEVVRPGVVVTKGDANNAPDAWVAELKGQRVWKVRAAVPGVGYALERLRTPAARRLALFVVPLLLAALWLKDIWRDDDELPVTTPRLRPQPQPLDARGALAVVALLSVGALASRQRA